MSDPFSPPRTFDLAGMHVVLAMPSHRHIHPHTVVSLLNTQRAMIERGIPIDIEHKYGGSIVHHVRTKVAWDFLQTKGTHLFWVDSDIVWKAKDFIRLLALATQCDVVAGAYPAKQDPTIFMGRALGTIETNEFGLLPVGGIGMGFCVMSRKVVETLGEKAPKKRFHDIPQPIPHLFYIEGDDVDDGRGAEGEDMAFFARANAAGFQLWVDPTIELGHVGDKVYTGRILDHLQRADTSAAA